MQIFVPNREGKISSSTAATVKLYYRSASCHPLPANEVSQEQSDRSDCCSESLQLNVSPAKRSALFALAAPAPQWRPPGSHAACHFPELQ